MYIYIYDRERYLKGNAHLPDAISNILYRCWFIIYHSYLGRLLFRCGMIHMAIHSPCKKKKEEIYFYIWMYKWNINEGSQPNILVRKYLVCFFFLLCIHKLWVDFRDVAWMSYEDVFKKNFIRLSFPCCCYEYKKRIESK